MNRIVRFALKPASEKRITVRFLSRKALSKLPFMPVPMQLGIAPGETLRFWWSYLPMADHPSRTLLEYWGDDCSELRFLWKYLDPGMTFFDVGAYHGIFSILAAMKLGSRGQVVVFEPSPRERRRLKLHLRMNGINGVRLEPYAVSARAGGVKFFTVTSGLTSMNSLQPPHIDHPIREIAVEAVSLDEYLTEQRISRLDLLKIDVEGGELQAFSGATQLLTSIRPVLVCEVLDWVTRPWGYPARQIVDFLSARGYAWFDFCDDGSLEPHVPRDEYPEIRNYLAVPREKLAFVERWCRR
jgi:FkbM family methyltransferase